MDTSRDPARALLRHTLATVAYRGSKTLRDVPDGFAGFRVSPESSTRTPVEVLAHIGDLFDWGLWLARGEKRWRTSTPLPWDEEVARFWATLQAFDDYLASDAPLGAPVEQLLQGPVADSLTHIGQLAMLRRLAGGPVRGENYFKARIETGRVGPEQAKPKVEFD
jgi:hypothetical protein